ncbi:hypothetical protein DINM_000883 [Dirofilaria immitis]|nr:hypothetical protein [Dirofilaria immitis]
MISRFWVCHAGIKNIEVGGKRIAWDKRMESLVFECGAFLIDGNFYVDVSEKDGRTEGWEEWREWKDGRIEGRKSGRNGKMEGMEGRKDGRNGKMEKMEGMEGIHISSSSRGEEGNVRMWQ